MFCMAGKARTAVAGGGGGPDVIAFSNATASATEIGALATATYQINSDGYVYTDDGSGPTVFEQWCTPGSSGGNYEVYAVANVGFPTTGTTGAWLPTSGNPAWTKTRPTLGVNSVDMTLSVRLAGGDGTVLDTWLVSIEAEVV